MSKIMVDGKSLQQIADEHGISYNTLYVRWKRNGVLDLKPKQEYKYKEEPIITQETKERIKESGIPYATVYARLNIGWDLERALSTIKPKETMLELAQKHSVSYDGLLRRIKRGMTPDEAIEQMKSGKRRKSVKSMNLRELYELNQSKDDEEQEDEDNSFSISIKSRDKAKI
ncbi:MAG: hypothetical protein HQK68_04745, partial [Desulfamplus sp.]|nr:hypothetical protein [Desulfamplus sp.]